LWIRLTSNTVGFDGKFDISKRFEIQPWHVWNLQFLIILSTDFLK
jgi:hypothetical protein